MHFKKIVIFSVLVIALCILINGASSTKTAAKRKNKEKKETKNRHKGVSEEDENDAEIHTEPPVAHREANPTDIQEQVFNTTDIIPSRKHNGQIRKDKHNTKTPEEIAEKKARKKEIRVQRRKEERNESKHSEATVESRQQDRKARRKETKKAEKKAEKKALRKEQRKLKKKGGKDSVTQEGDIISFDDIVHERHGDPLPNPAPITEEHQHHNRTEGDDGSKTKKQNKKRNHKEKKHKSREHKKRNRKNSRHEHEMRNLTACETSDDCPRGRCCIEKHGFKICKPSAKKDSGQQCFDSCMCKAGLECYQVLKAHKQNAKGRCQVKGTSNLPIKNLVGTIEDTVQHLLHREEELDDNAVGVATNENNQ